MQAQYRSYPQSAQRSPHATAGRRGPGPMVPNQHAQPAPTQQQILAQQAAEAQKRELAKRRSSKPTDRNIPEGVEDIIVGDGVQRYRSLREVERRLDAVMMRKRLDVQDSQNRGGKKYRTLRIWVSNTAENQPWQQTSLDPGAFDFESANQPTYRVKIEGRLLDDEDELDGGEQKEGENTGADAEKDGDAMEQDGADSKKNTPTKPPIAPMQRTKLSHFFKQITIDFDRSKSLQPDTFEPIQWTKPKPTAGVPNTSPEANFDCLEFERKSDENINVTINLIRDEQPERYRLSKPLAELLDTEEEDRAGVVMGIWNYIKAMGLQEVEETRTIHCDARLKAIFNTDTLFFPYIPEQIYPHLSPLPPLRLPYTIRVDRAHATAPDPTIYDVRVATDDPSHAPLPLTSPTTLSTLQSLAQLDELLLLLIQRAHTGKAKHAFFDAMARDPAGFVRRWVGSQRRDLGVILGEASGGAEFSRGEREGGWRVGLDGQGDEWRMGGEAGVWGREEARESVGLWLAKMKQGH